MRHQTYFFANPFLVTHFTETALDETAVSDKAYTYLSDTFLPKMGGRETGQIWASWGRSDNVLSSFINRSGDLMPKERWEGRGKEKKRKREEDIGSVTQRFQNGKCVHIDLTSTDCC
ncbi:hypothetical protein CERZMDRAFT_91444 [Cercospora zeae-maydis SCOH1-5]|uniref:Uncharacterized protein n=1 Tax=Cercospora zeae-maydis SCOH1-5 TaxID=717836 RepID=A0A6A6F880_9PEZI|nr:hypothetical protein CERZMDRAFT_91444 [Cercospora zeae-maydis SCOH1-5]